MHDAARLEAVLPPQPGEVYGDSVFASAKSDRLILAYDGMPSIVQTGVWRGPDTLAQPSQCRLAGASDRGRVQPETQLQACLVVLRVHDAQPQDAPVYRPRPPELWSVAQAVMRICAMLEDAPQGGALMGFLPDIKPDQPHQVLRTKTGLASTLVAGLELARKGVVALEQERPWGQIEITIVAD